MPHPCTRALALLLLCLGSWSSPPLGAQIVNIEDQRKPLDSLGWFGQLDLNGALTRNNNTVITAGGALRLDRLGRRGNVLFLSDYRLVRVTGRNALNAGFGHLRYGYEPRDGWRWESFGQLQYNEQLRLSLRALIGTGWRRRLYRADKSRGYLGLLYMFEYDEFTESRLTYRDHRLSSYLTLRLQATSNLYLAATVYYQPRLPDFSFPRVSGIGSLTLTATKALRFTSNLSLSHDERLNRDFPEVPATTLKWTNGLRLLF